MSMHSMSSRRRRATARHKTQAQRPAIPHPDQRPAAAQQPAHPEPTPEAETQLARTQEAAQHGGSAVPADMPPRSQGEQRSYHPRPIYADGIYEDEMLPLASMRGAGRGPFHNRSGFTWRERDWRASGWARRARVLPGIAALLAIVIIATAFAFVLASRAATTARSSGQPAATNVPESGVLVQQLPAATTPTPAMPPYEIGVWVDNPTPSGGSEHVFVRVSHDVAAVVGAPVTLTVQFGNGQQTYGPVHTDKDGVATFTVGYGGGTGYSPVFVTATTTTSGQTLSAETTFFPAG